MTAKSRTGLVVGVIAGLVLAGVLVAILLWAIARNTSPGEPVGQIDLRAPGATLLVDLAAGDALHFRIDGLFGAPPGGSNRTRAQALDTKLRASVLTVVVSGQQSSCPAYFGAGRQGTIGPTTVEKSMVTECTIVVTTPGRRTVQATVTWAPGLFVHSAMLEVRVERAATR